MTRRLRHHDDSGAVLVMVAVFMVAAIASAALAVDIGRLTDRKRELQSLVDLVAIDAARAIEDGVPTRDVYDKVHAAAQASAARNGFLADDVEQLDVIVGLWQDATRTFVAYAPDDPVTGLLVPDAVRVVANSTVDYAFAPLAGRPSRLATATHRLAGDGTPLPTPTTTTTTAPHPCVASCPPSTTTTTQPPPIVRKATAGLGIGSFLVRAEADSDQALASADLLNALLSDYLSASQRASITAVGYEGLASAWISLDELRAALRFGTVGELLGAEVAAPDLIDAMATILTADGAQAAVEVGRISRSVDRNVRRVALRDLVSVASGYEGAAATASIDALSLLEGTAMLIDHDHVADIDVSSVFRRFSSARLRATIIEPPHYAFGPAEAGSSDAWATTARTAQIAIDLVLTTSIPRVGSAVMPFKLTGANGVASLIRIACPAGAPPETTIAADTSALTVAFGPVTGLPLGPLGLPSEASVPGSFGDLPFAWDGDGSEQVATVGSADAVTGVGATLLGADPLLSPIADEIDAALETVTSAVGLRIAGADIIAVAPVCTSAQLVN